MARRRKDTEAVEIPDNEKIEHGVPAPQEITAKIVMDRRDAVRRHTEKDRSDYDKNRAFLAGYQWLSWNAAERGFVPFVRKNKRAMETINQMDSLHNTLIAKLMKADLAFEVPSDAADDYAIHGAQLSEAVLRSKVRTDRWNSRREELYIATLTGATAAMQTDWDADAKKYGDVATGDTTETVLNITQFGLEPGAITPESATWWVKMLVLPPEQVQAMFDLAETPKSDAEAGGAYSGGVMGVTSENRSQGVMVTWYYEKPNALRPQGAVAVLVDKQLVWGPKPWPYPFKDVLNIDVARATVVPGQWLGETPLSKIRPIQVAYNAIYSQIQEQAKKIGAAKLAAPYGSSEALDAWDDDPGQPVRYPDGAQPPHYIAAPPLPGYMMQLLDRYKLEMQDIMGVHNISQGVTPANLESGVGLSILAEQDASPAARLAFECAKVLEGMATKVLKLYAANVTETRKSVVVDGKQSRGIAYTARWTGKTLAGQTTAIIPPDAILPRSHAAAQQMAMDFVKMGFFDPKDPASLTKVMEIAMIDDRSQIMWETDPGEARARWDIAKIAGGETVVPREYNDHKKCIDRGNLFRLSPEYDVLPQERQDDIDAWIQAHETMGSEEAGQQLQRAAISPALAAAPTANNAAPLPPELLSTGLPGAPLPPQAPALPGTPEGAQSQIPTGELQ